MRDDTNIEHDAEALEASVAASRPPDDLAAAAKELAGLSPLEYERVRESEAKQLDVRVKVLDNKGGMHIVTIDGNSGQIISAH